MIRSFGAGVALIFLLGACRNGSTGPVDNCLALEQAGAGSGTATACPLNITVSSGTKPTYTWNGNTSAETVGVVRVSDPGTVVWGIDNVQTPLKHGTAQTGSSVYASRETTLTAGVIYRVTVSRRDSRTCVAGPLCVQQYTTTRSKDFTP